MNDMLQWGESVIEKCNGNKACTDIILRPDIATLLDWC